MQYVTSFGMTTVGEQGGQQHGLQGAWKRTPTSALCVTLLEAVPERTSFLPTLPH